MIGAMFPPLYIGELYNKVAGWSVSLFKMITGSLEQDAPYCL